MPLAPASGLILLTPPTLPSTATCAAWLTRSWRACCQGGQRLKRGGPGRVAEPQDNAITVGMRTAWMTLGNHGASRNVLPLGAHMVFHSAVTATQNSPSLKRNPVKGSHRMQMQRVAQLHLHQHVRAAQSSPSLQALPSVLTTYMYLAD